MQCPSHFSTLHAAIFHELIEDSMKVFMDDFFIFGSSFDHCLKNLEKMLKRYEETNLVLNWEKSHFMVKEGIVLGHKVSGSGIEVDKAKIEAIFKLPYPTNVKAIRSFLGHADLYRRTKNRQTFQAHTLRQQNNELSTSELHNYRKRASSCCHCIRQIPSIPGLIQDHQFDIEIREKKGAENLAADHLSQLENPNLGKLTKAEIRDLFPEERLMAISDKNNEPWYTDYANYLASRCADQIIRRWMTGDEATQILQQCHSGPSGGHHGIATTARKVFEAGFYWPHIFRDAYFMGPFPSSNGNKYILVAIDYVSKWVAAQAFPTSDARNVVNFLKRLFVRFGIPKALISDRGTHFCNYQMEKAKKRYGVIHRFSTAYHP
ncbi:reverse transcriptase domain-containing protein [Tanacetum coccineum]